MRNGGGNRQGDGGDEPGRHLREDDRGKQVHVVRVPVLTAVGQRLRFACGQMANRSTPVDGAPDDRWRGAV